MKIVVAPDKFRGSLSAEQAAQALAAGAALAAPNAEIDVVPMADGGEGTVEALVAATGGRRIPARVTGPLGQPVDAEYGRLGDGQTAVIEMASASGHRHVPPHRRDPSRTTTYGTGELLLAAIDAGARRVILGIGGSATNDGGVGFAQALGYRFLNASGREIPPGGGGLEHLDHIEASRRDTRLDGVVVDVACDVTNPLTGPDGASAVFGPQKGADPAMVVRLDANLKHFAQVVLRDLGADVDRIPGAGAAGGLGAGLVAFTGGRLEPGIDLVVRTVGLADRLKGAMLCLTGEGAVDSSSAFGKTAVGVARLARSLGVPTFAIAGALGKGCEAVEHEGVDAMFSLCPRPVPLDDALANAGPYLERAAYNAVRAFLVGWRAGQEHPR